MEVISDTPAVRGPTPLARLSAASVSSRLHLAIVLVGWVRLPAEAVLDLCWSDLDLSTRTLACDGQTVVLGERLVKLFEWHEVRQRLDWLVAEPWQGTGPGEGRVFLDERGNAFDMGTANAHMAACCTTAGVAVVPLSGLRHPVMRG